VDHGVTGFLCHDQDDLVAALGRVDEIDRADCRMAAELRFSRARMASDHLWLYQRLLETPSLETPIMETPSIGMPIRELSRMRASVRS
jgi:hypothetical protein